MVLTKLSWVLLTKIRQLIYQSHGVDLEKSSVHTGQRIPSGQETASLCTALPQRLVSLAFHEPGPMKCTFCGFCISQQIYDKVLCSLIRFSPKP